MSVEENKALVRRFIEEIWRQGKLDRLNDFFATDYADYSFDPRQAVDREGLREFLAMFRNAFHDLKYDLHDMIAEGDKVVSRDTVRATHKGEFMGIPPTGKRVEVTAIHILRIADGKIVEHWGNTDQLGLMQQLSVIPSPGEE
ncbi:MAG: ester cyclase [Candidatus Bipolaricaulia bacterium]